MKKYTFLGVLTLLIIGLLSNSGSAFPNLAGKKTLSDPNYSGTIGLWVDPNIQTSAYLSFMVYWNFKVNDSVNLTKLGIYMVSIKLYNETTQTQNYIGGIDKGNASPSSPIISTFENKTVSGYSLQSMLYTGSSINACFVVSVYYLYNQQNEINLTHDGCINSGNLLTLSMPNTTTTTKSASLSVIPIFLSVIAIAIFRKKKKY